MCDMDTTSGNTNLRFQLFMSLHYPPHHFHYNKALHFHHVGNNSTLCLLSISLWVVCEMKQGKLWYLRGSIPYLNIVVLYCFSLIALDSQTTMTYVCNLASWLGSLGCQTFLLAHKHTITQSTHLITWSNYLFIASWIPTSFNSYTQSLKPKTNK